MDATLKRFLDELYAFGQREGGMWNVPPETAQFLRMLVIATNAKRILEIGTSNGYSTIWLALGARVTDGRIATLEADPKKVRLARENFARAGVASLIELREGDALKSLKKLEGPFDFVFIDAAKEEYLRYYQLALPKTRLGGLLLADNAISHADGMRDFLDFVSHDARVETVLVPIGSGEQMMVRLR